MDFFKNKFFKGKKGFMLFFIFLMLSGVLLVFLFAIILPATNQFNTDLYIEGKNIINSTNISQYPQEVQDTFTSAMSSSERNAVTINYMYMYSPFIIFGIILIVVFLFSRMIVETRGGGGYV